MKAFYLQGMDRELTQIKRHRSTRHGAGGMDSLTHNE